jgi:hypothetical protein
MGCHIVFTKDWVNVILKSLGKYTYWKSDDIDAYTYYNGVYNKLPVSAKMYFKNDKYSYYKNENF